MMLLGSIQKNPKKTAGGLRRVGWERRRDGLQSQGTATRSAGLAGLRGPGRRADRELGGVSPSVVDGEAEGGGSDPLSRARCMQKTKQVSAFV